jgi:hypothetical protein
LLISEILLPADQSATYKGAPEPSDCHAPVALSRPSIF